MMVVVSVPLGVSSESGRCITDQKYRLAALTLNYLKEQQQPRDSNAYGRLPLVVYVPDGVEVRYRIWAAAAEARPMEKG